MPQNVTQKSINCVKKVSDRSKQYAEVWNQNMFLNNFEKRDENVGVNIQLKELYKEKCLPHYIWKNNNRECCDLAELLQEYICEYTGNKMLLIKGQSGVGKSTLITWILNKYEEFKDNIYVYSFASDLQNIRWDETREKKNYIINNILDELDIMYDGLDGKTLILDGFDEINVKGSRSEILNDIYQEVHGITNICGVSVIITCRENYIENDNNIMCDYITLCPFDEKQIKEFCKAFEYKTCSEISSSMVRSIIAKKEIFGIPLILYMTLALDISIDNESSIVDIYDKIFSTNNGSIYNRCIDNKNYGDKHRISILKEQIHQISRDIAMWMFENRPFEAVIPKIEYDKICGNNINRIKFNQQDVAIGNYFELVHHTDGMGGQEICFIHRSIYEYFIVDAIFSNIEEYMLELTEENKEKVAKSIANSLKKV